MKVSKTNFKKLIPLQHQDLMENLLNDLAECNSMMTTKIHIDIQTYHDEYSPERTDPCPDYYGYYTLRLDSDNIVNLTDKITIDDLDHCLMFLNNILKLCLT